MMDFFEVLSKKEEMIFNNAMIFLQDFFNENKKYFNIIIMRYNHQPTPKKELINFIKNDYRDIDLFLNDYLDFKFMDYEDKTIDFLSQKRGRDENEELDDINTNNLMYNYKKKYENTSEYLNINKMMNKDKNDNDNDEEKNEDIFKNFEVNNVNTNNLDEDDDDDEEHYYRVSKK